MLRVKDLKKSYDGYTLFENTNFEGKRGEIIGIVGQTGCGKTTLLNILSGYENADSGEVYVNDKNINTFSEEEVDDFRRNKVAFLFQSYNLIEELSVYDNLKISLYFDESKYSVIDSYLEKVGLTHLKNRKVSKLSGGEKQRIALLRALIKDFDILICDEPTGNLDETNTKLVYDLITDLFDDRLVVIVTHKKRLTTNYLTKLFQLDYDNSKFYSLFENEIDDVAKTKKDRSNDVKTFGLFKHSLKRLLIMKSFNLILFCFMILFMISFSVSIVVGSSKYEDFVLRGELLNFPLYEIETSNLTEEQILGLEELESVKSVSKVSNIYSHLKLKSSEFTYRKSSDSQPVKLNFINGEEVTTREDDRVFNIRFRRNFLISYEDIDNEMYRSIIEGRLPESGDEVLLDIKTAISLIEVYDINFARYLKGEVTAEEVLNKIKDDRLVFYNVGPIFYNTETSMREQNCYFAEFKIVGVLDSKLISNYQEGVYLFANSYDKLKNYHNQIFSDYSYKIVKNDPTEETHINIMRYLGDDKIISQEVVDGFSSSYAKVNGLITYNLILLVISLIFFLSGLVIVILYVYSKFKRSITLYRSLGFNRRDIRRLLSFGQQVSALFALVISVFLSTIVVSRFLELSGELKVMLLINLFIAFMIVNLLISLAAFIYIKIYSNKSINSIL